MRKIPAVLLALPVGELSKPEALTERAYAVALSAKVSSTAKAFPPRRRFRRKQALQMPFSSTTPPVKMESRSVRRRSGIPNL